MNDSAVQQLSQSQRMQQAKQPQPLPRRRLANLPHPGMRILKSAAE